MKPLAFPLLADENIHPEVVAYLRAEGSDIQSVQELGFGGSADIELLLYAHSAGRVILTHDSDFGRLAFAQQQTFPGIIYLRPGHIESHFTVHTLNYLRSQDIDVEFPFVIVAKRQQQRIRVRVRQM